MHIETLVSLKCKRERLQKYKIQKGIEKENEKRFTSTANLSIPTITFVDIIYVYHPTFAMKTKMLLIHPRSISYLHLLNNKGCTNRSVEVLECIVLSKQ